MMTNDRGTEVYAGTCARCGPTTRYQANGKCVRCSAMHGAARYQASTPDSRRYRAEIAAGHPCAANPDHIRDDGTTLRYRPHVGDTHSGRCVECNRERVRAAWRRKAWGITA